MTREKRPHEHEAEKRSAARASGSGAPEEPAEPAAAGESSQAVGESGGEEAATQKARADEYLRMAQQLQADFENYKKRMLREQTHAIERASERVVRELLPVIDDLDRTLTASESEEAAVAAEHLADAIRLVRDKLLAAMAKEGVEVIDPAGQPFDPNEAEAMMQVARDDLDEHTCVEVYQKGYRMHGKLIRAAKVVVSCKA